MLIVECLADLLMVILVGGLISILSGGIVVYTIVKVFGLDEIRNWEDKDDYILTKDDEKFHTMTRLKNKGEILCY